MGHGDSCPSGQATISVWTWEWPILNIILLPNSALYGRQLRSSSGDCRSTLVIHQNNVSCWWTGLQKQPSSGGKIGKAGVWPTLGVFVPLLGSFGQCHHLRALKILSVYQGWSIRAMHLSLRFHCDTYFPSKALSKCLDGQVFFTSFSRLRI